MTVCSQGGLHSKQPWKPEIVSPSQSEAGMFPCQSSQDNASLLGFPCMNWGFISTGFQPCNRPTASAILTRVCFMSSSWDLGTRETARNMKLMLPVTQWILNGWNPFGILLPYWQTIWQCECWPSSHRQHCCLTIKQLCFPGLLSGHSVPHSRGASL